MDYAKLFEAVSPGFFEWEGIRNLPEDDVCVEQVMWLKDWDIDKVPLACPDNITFGIYDGPNEPLKEAVAKVDEDWVKYFGPGRKTFCAFDGGKIVSFCNVDKMCEFEGARGGPGLRGHGARVQKAGDRPQYGQACHSAAEGRGLRHLIHPLHPPGELVRVPGLQDRGQVELPRHYQQR